MSNPRRVAAAITRRIPTRLGNRRGETALSDRGFRVGNSTKDAKLVFLTADYFPGGGFQFNDARLRFNDLRSQFNDRYVHLC